ncbi:MAG: hypothetical protein KA104_02030 [Candidatus Pacebacteria bacterium]|nr:hypothetical protein [Candidatus Paceibacterota bacterium]
MREKILGYVKKEFLPLLVLVLILLGMAGASYLYDQVHTNSLSYPEVKEVSGTDWSFQKYSTYFQQLSDKKGAVYAFRVLRQVNLPPVIDMHLLAHIVGDMLYKQKGIAGMKDCTDEFRNACSHSVVIGYLREFGEGALPEIVKTCMEAPGGRGAYTMCFHGLGHGVLAYTGYNLEKAIAMCKKTGTEEFHNREYIECAGGAVMEMTVGVHDRGVWESQAPKYFIKGDPLSPCDADFMSPEVRPICYMHITPELFKAAGSDLGILNPDTFPKAMGYCEAIPKDAVEDRKACFGGFGKEYIMLASGHDIRDLGLAKEPGLRRIRAACSATPNPEGQANCNEMALNSLYWGGENTPDASFTYCQIAEGQAQRACYEQLANNIGYYLSKTEKGRAECARLPSEYRGICSR